MAERGSINRRVSINSSKDLSCCTCAICAQAVRDARLLSCLHSFCRSCVEDLDMRTGRNHKIVCPVCRSTTHLPEAGAAGLARDITVAVNPTSACRTCSADDGDGKAEVSCSTCDFLFCAQHGVPHVLANPGHHLGAMPPMARDATSSSSESRLTAFSVRLCDEHGRPARYFCQRCSTPICGECTALGAHHGHKPIVSVRDIAKDLKQRVRRKTDHTRLKQIQKVLSAVQETSTQLSSRADTLRTRIRSSARRVHDAIDQVTQQKLAQVDDLEMLRLRNLACQHDELKQHADSLESMFTFGEKVLERHAETEDAYVCELLLAVEKRADELDGARLEEQPVAHARMEFDSVSEETLLSKANELVGDVVPCQGSATHSFVKGEPKKWGNEGSPVTFVLVTKDYNGRRLATGGDAVRVQQRQNFPSVGCRHFPEVVDNSDGTYTINIVPRQGCDCSFDIIVNSIKLEQRLSVSCRHPVLGFFDPVECQADSTLSGDKLKVTHTGHDHWSSVLSSCGMHSGLHTWKVNVTKSTIMNIFLGVARKPGLTTKEDNYQSAYSWHGIDGKKCILGQRSPSIGRWQENDVLEFHLDCAKHTLTIVNLRSREADNIVNLPPTELFAYFALANKDDSLTLVP